MPENYADLLSKLSEMKKPHSCLYLLCLCFLVCACNIPWEKAMGSKDVKLITVKKADYSMGIPSFMTETTTLHDDASLQFMNMFQEAYVIVIDESRDEFITALQAAEMYDSSTTVIMNYANTQLQLTGSKLNVITRSDVKTLRINGLIGASAEMDATLEGVPSAISYFMTFFESKTKLYMVMAWTLQSKKETHREAFDKMSRSFISLKTQPEAEKVADEN
jgi:hypothetical protein